MSVHVTPDFAESYRTVAEKYEGVLTTTLAAGGETATEIGSRGAIVIAATAERVVSATELAVSVTAAFAVTVGGGVYVVETSLAVIEGATDPHAVEHGAPPWVRDHMTPALLTSFWTVAVNVWVALTATIAEAGETETAITARFTT